MGNILGSRKKLPKEDLEFLRTNTNFTKKQIKQWYRGFIRDCPSGQLSKKKFIEVYSGFFPDGDAEEFCTHVFRTFDKDNSGKIDFKEFLLAINITSGGKPEEKLEWAFQMYDINGNGTIEKHEMVEIIKTFSQVTKANQYKTIYVDKQTQKRDVNSFLKKNFRFISYLILITKYNVIPTSCQYDSVLSVMKY
ncbi:unnamed protein product [Schistosoma guineensis]|nr:unnamed protein product [Schistosoma guineensis]